jgi:hypothetical protein
VLLVAHVQAVAQAVVVVLVKFFPVSCKPL